MTYILGRILFMQNWDLIDQKVKKWLTDARERIINSFEQVLDIETKSNRNDLVTNIDKETEQFFIANIRKEFPNHQILGEEGFGDQLTSLDGIVWIIDPIDGTMNFVHQQCNFAISIGIYEDGVGKLAYIYDVVHQELYYAKAGHGAFLNERQLPKLEDQVQLADAVIAMNATWLTHNRYMDPTNLQKLVNNVRGTRSYGSAALEFAYVAAGRLDAYITMRLSPWDFAAGKIIVEELGGRVTNLAGEELNLLEKNSIIVAKPRLHKDIVEKYLLHDRQ